MVVINKYCELNLCYFLKLSSCIDLTSIVIKNDNTGTIESMPTLISLLSLNIRFELMGKHMKSILTKVIELNWFSKKLSIQLGTPNGRKLRPCVVNH